MGIYARGSKLWMSYRDEDGRRQWKSTGFDVGQEEQAEKLLATIEREVAKRVAAARPNSRVVTVSGFAARWIEERRQLGIAEWANDKARLDHHVLPAIGRLPLDQVRAKDLVALFRRLRLSGEMAPRTIYNVYSNVKALFRDAQLEDLIESSPAVLTGKQLGPNIDADPEWRSTAVFERSELEALIGDPRVPADRQLVYALQGLAGLRQGEMCGLRWKHYNPNAEPLGKLLVAKSYNKRTKTQMSRDVPVHPALAAMLAQWRLEGWAAMWERQPQPDDLVVPMPPEHAARRRNRPDSEPMRSKNYSRKRLIEDLDALGFRHRRGHDLRRTFISLAQVDGARRDILRLITHTPNARNAIDLYTTYPWATLCGEVAKLKIDRAQRGQVIALPIAQAAGSAPISCDGAVTVSARRGHHTGNRVEAPGVEPGSEDASERASTCVAGSLNSRLKTAVSDLLRALVDPEVSPDDRSALSSD